MNKLPTFRLREDTCTDGIASLGLAVEVNFALIIEINKIDLIVITSSQVGSIYDI